MSVIRLLLTGPHDHAASCPSVFDPLTVAATSFSRVTGTLDLDFPH